MTRNTRRHLHKITWETPTPDMTPETLAYIERLNRYFEECELALSIDQLIYLKYEIDRLGMQVQADPNGQYWMSLAESLLKWARSDDHILPFEDAAKLSIYPWPDSCAPIG